MEKEQVLAEIRRMTKERGGKPPGRTAFEKATGVRDWYPHLWVRWGDALEEAGFEANQLATAYSDETIFVHYVRLARELGRLPVIGEIRVKARSDGTFPSHTVFQRFGGKAELLEKLRGYCAGKPELADIVALLPVSSGEAPVRLSRAPIEGYVYMMRSGRRYKIGFTNSPSRRHREVKLELPDPTDLVHSIETDDPKGIEAYWHRRFAAKRVRDTEFFELDAADVAAFRRRRYQ